MRMFSKIFSCRPSRRTSLIAGVLIAVIIAVVAYERLVVAPKRQQVIRRYNEFRTVVAAGDAQRIMEFVAPEFRSWADGRLHIYNMIAVSLDEGSTVRVSAGEATICPKPDRHFLVIPGGHVIKMVEREGNWFVGRAHID